MAARKAPAHPGRGVGTRAPGCVRPRPNASFRAGGEAGARSERVRKEGGTATDDADVIGRLRSAAMSAGPVPGGTLVASCPGSPADVEIFFVFFRNWRGNFTTIQRPGNGATGPGNHKCSCGHF